MDLLQHFVLYNLAPDAFDLVRPVRTYTADSEKFPRIHKPKHILLHDWDRDSFDAFLSLLPHEEAWCRPGRG